MAVVVEKQVARTIATGNLNQDPRNTSGADVTGGLASASRLGSLLWRLKLANDRDSVKPLELMLAREIARGGERFTALRRLAALALREYIDTRCKPCGGRGAIAGKIDRVVRRCATCAGSGIEKVNDQRRILQLGCSENAYEKKWKARFAEAYNVLQQHDAETGRTMRAQLSHEAHNE